LCGVVTSVAYWLDRPCVAAAAHGFQPSRPAVSIESVVRVLCFQKAPLGGVVSLVGNCVLLPQRAWQAGGALGVCRPQTRLKWVGLWCAHRVVGGGFRLVATIGASPVLGGVL